MVRTGTRHFHNGYFPTRLVVVVEEVRVLRDLDAVVVTLRLRVRVALHVAVAGTGRSGCSVRREGGAGVQPRGDKSPTPNFQKEQIFCPIVVVAGVGGVSGLGVAGSAAGKASRVR